MRRCLSLLPFLILSFFMHQAPSWASTLSHLPFGKLRKFRSDGCSHFVDGNLSNPYLWHECCVQHDLKYWAGGTARQRLKADREMFYCVANKGQLLLAHMMYEAVREAGSPYWATSFRWGFGWQKIRGYTPLNATELEMVKAMTPQDLSPFALEWQESY